MDLKDFLKESSILEEKEKKKYSYKDKDGNKITIKKTKDGNVVKIDADGKETEATELDFTLAKSRSEEQENKKEEEKEEKKAAKKAEKEQKKLEKDLKKKEKKEEKEAQRARKEHIKRAREQAKYDDNEEDDHTFAKRTAGTIDKAINSLSTEYGVVGQCIGFLASLTSSIIVDTYDDAKSLFKRSKRPDDVSEEEWDVAALQKTEELINKDKDVIDKMGADEREQYEEFNNTYEKMIRSYYDEEGNLRSKEDAKKALKDSMSEEDFKEFKDHQEKLAKEAKKNPDTKKLAKSVSSMSKDDVKKLNKTAKKNVKRAYTDAEKKDQLFKELQKACKEADEEYKLKKKEIEDKYKNDSSGNSALEKEASSKKKNLEDYKEKNKDNKKISKELYDAEVKKLELDYERTNNEYESNKQKLEDEKNKSLKKAKEKKDSKKLGSLDNYIKVMNKIGAKNSKDTPNDKTKGVKDKLEEQPKEDKPKEDKPKEEKVKDRDGSEIVSRAKKRGKGITYVRKRGGKEIGGASKEQFMAAKRRQKNESLTESLKDNITESITEYLKN